MRRFLGFYASQCRRDRRLARIFFGGSRRRFRRSRGIRLLLCLFGLHARQGGRNGRFTRIVLCCRRGGVVCRRRLFARFHAGQRRGHGGFTRVVAGGRRWRFRFHLGSQLGTTFARLRFTCFAGSDHLAVIRLLAVDRRNRRFGILAAHARQRGLHCALIVVGQFDGGLFMSLFTRQFFTLQTRQLGLVTRLGLGGARRFQIDSLDFGLFLPVVLYQRDIAGADERAGTAFDAVEQVMVARLVVLLPAAEPIQLLWQQPGRASVYAQAAADAGLLRFLRRHFIHRRRQNAVADLDDWHVQRGQGEAHQRAAHDHHLLRLRAETDEVEQVLHRRADASPQIAGALDRLAGQGHYALNQRFAVDDRSLDGEGGADVLHQYADSGGVLTVRHFLAGQNFGQLLGAAGRVFGRDDAQRNAGLAAQRLFQRRDCLRFIVFDADQRELGLQNVLQDLRAFNDLIGMFLHQTVVGGNVRLTLGGVEDQRFHAAHAALQFAGGRKTCAAQAGDASLMNTLNQFRGGRLAIVRHRIALAPAVFPVCLDNHAQLRQPGRVRGDVRRNGADGARGRGVHRHGAAAADGQRLAFQHPIAGADAQLAFRPQMLLQRNDKGLGQGRDTQRRTAGLRFHFRWMDPAVEIPDPVFFKGGEQIKHVAPRGSLAPGSSSCPTSSWRWW